MVVPKQETSLPAVELGQAIKSVSPSNYKNEGAQMNNYTLHIIYILHKIALF